MHYAVIMAGGAGTRLWPAARQDRPKQLHRLIFERPLIAETVSRLMAAYPAERILIVTAARYADAIRGTVPDLPPGSVLCEPFGRNTAAAIALAAFRIAREDPDAVFAVFPADHVILKPDALFRALDVANDLATQHRVVDIGVPPSHPETGYGYIELGERIASRDGIDAFDVRRFVEKPDRQTAEQYLAAGNYMWNSGMFVWRTGEYLAALREYLPETYGQLEAAAGRGEEALAAAYEQIPDISIDYAIMEKISDVVAVPVDFGWRDIGDWAAVYDMLDHDPEGNSFSGEHVTLDTGGSLIVAPGKLVATIGVSDLIIVEDGEVLLVMRRDRAQDVKKILDRLKETGRERYL
jgi:mannose-1-phosphate guanylyltransferase